LVFSSISILLTLFVVAAMAAACIGVWVSSASETSRHLVPFSGVVLILMALVWVLPELTEHFGVAEGTAFLLAAVGAVWIVDRYVYPVCPACSHNHDHGSCSTRLHGFAAPLIVAAALHSVFDGYMFALGQGSGPGAAAAHAVSAGIFLHKLPEALAFGVILRAALRSRRKAMGWALFTQAAVLPGFVLEASTAAQADAAAMLGLLAIAGGTFLYLGAHAVHAEWRRRLAHKAWGGRLVRAGPPGPADASKK
jgi:zinc transporter ZupT